MLCRRRFLGVGMALVLAGCSGEGEPDDAAIRQAIERVHQDWVARRRKDQKAQTPELFRGLPNVNLAFEADLALRITSVRKLDCRRPPDGALGYVCRAVIGASVAGRPTLLQNIEGRFVRGGSGWLVHDLVVINPDTGRK